MKRGNDVVYAGGPKTPLQPGEDVDVSRHVLAASGYFDAIAVQLSGHGFRDEPITWGFADEARLLLRAVGGAVGGGRGSSSSG